MPESLAVLFAEVAGVGGGIDVNICRMKSWVAGSVDVKGGVDAPFKGKTNCALF